MRKLPLIYFLLIIFFTSLIFGYFLHSNNSFVYVSNSSNLKGISYYLNSFFVVNYFVFGPIFLIIFSIISILNIYVSERRISICFYLPSVGFIISYFFPKFSVFLGNISLDKFYFCSFFIFFFISDIFHKFFIVKTLLRLGKQSYIYLIRFLENTFNNTVSSSIKRESVSNNYLIREESIIKQSSVIADNNFNTKKILNFKKNTKNFSRSKFLTKKFKDSNYENIVDLFSSVRRRDFSNEPSRSYFDDITTRIEEKLKDFKITGEIINILKGPVVDTFELELGPGVKVSKITSSAEDLSLALLGAPLRIVYPMKGRTTVGIEVPRNPRDIIFLDQLVNSKEFKGANHLLPLAMGKDAFGDPLIVDLTSMPHMLVAGSTGAGKSVFINSVLISLLIKLDPNKLKLILIDPKQLELALYSNLPHLAMPVVTDANRASTSLLWAVQEMERRYSIMKTLSVRNIEGYNDKIKTKDKELLNLVSKFFESGEDYQLPYIVIIVDEFADLILTKSGKEIETNICRLAAKARASGIHLIIATQRPSVDVITGLIKSNFPTRVSFRVTSSVDSRTILNSVGAERLLGKGDMLYKHGVETLRCHSSFVDEVEIEKLTNRLSELSSGFDPVVIDFLENGGDLSDSPYGQNYSSHKDGLNGNDELYGAAVKLVAESRAASASMLQRRLKIGYNRAANLVEKMEENGVVGPSQGSKPRKVLIDSSNL
jgi:hypothetical protein